MEKEVRRFTVAHELDWGYGVKISTLREDLDAIEKLGATHVEISASVSYDTAELYIIAEAERIETDGEFNARVEELTKRQERIRQDELTQLAVLKVKYELRGEQAK